MSSFEAPVLVSEVRAELRTLRSSRLVPADLALRAGMVLWAAEGRSAGEIAELAGVSINTVRLWVSRFREEGLSGLEATPHPGRARQIDGKVRSRILALTRKSPPEASGLSHWSSRTMAKHLRRHERIDVSHVFVADVWRAAGLKPWRQGTFKLSRDPHFAEKVVDVVGLYLDPPAGAVVLSLDEKSQCQALDRTQPVLPITFGKTEQRTHDYIRHGTTTLFGALNVGTGEVQAKCFDTHTSKDFLQFMDHVVAGYPDDELHIVLDNFATHKTEAVATWLTQHPKVSFHFTPVGGSWLNQIEIWFGNITRQAIRRGTFSSVRALITTIENWTDSWNDNPKPFTWTATADEILAKVRLVEQSARALTGH